MEKRSCSLPLDGNRSSMAKLTLRISRRVGDRRCLTEQVSVGLLCESIFISDFEQAVHDLGRDF